MSLTAPEPNIAPVASQFNNVLHVIRGTSEILENAWEGMPDGNRYFEMLRESVDAASRLTSAMIEQAGYLHQKAQTAQAELPTQPTHPDQPLPRGHGELVLIIDDDPLVIRIASRMLTTHGYRVSSADGAARGIELYRTSPEPIDLVLLDFHMPEMDGEETFLALRALDPDAAVLLNSGFSEREALQRMLSRGLLGFIPKPHTQRDLLVQIRVTLDALAGAKPAAIVAT